MSLNSNALLTVDDVFQYLKMPIPSPDDPNYALIESLINRVSDYVMTYLKGPVIIEQVTETVSGDGTDEVLVDRFPIRSVVSVQVDGETIPVENIQVEEYGLVTLKSGAFPRGRRNVKITYTAGYGTDPDTIPQDIRQAALLIVHYWYKRDALDYSQTFGESEVIVGQWRFPESAARMLDGYKKMRMSIE